MGIYNCVFEDPYGVLSSNFFELDSTYRFDVRISKLEILNSSFYSPKNIAIFNIYASKSIIDKIKVINSATSSSIIGYQASASSQTNLTNVVFDENYNIVSPEWRNVGTGINPDGSQAHIGIYGGQYAWSQ